MEREQVESSQIKSIGYEPQNYALEIEFKGGSVYRYDNVPGDQYQGLMSAESKGTYFGKFIKPFVREYPFTKIRGTDKEEAKKDAAAAIAAAGIVTAQGGAT